MSNANSLINVHQPSLLQRLLYRANPFQLSQLIPVKGLRDRVQALQYIGKQRDQVFTIMYEQGYKARRAATTQILQQTQPLREKLPELFRTLKVKSILDAGCGDFGWMQETDLGIDRYIGVDIVAGLVLHMQDTHGTVKQVFMPLDIVESRLPNADLIVCRDCLVHLSTEDAIATIRNFKKTNATYLLATTYPGLVGPNSQNSTGNWRPLDLQAAPFNFPAPITLISEEKTGSKSMGLWRLKDIRL
jgi:SAM-dependent methyltransferase